MGRQGHGPTELRAFLRRAKEPGVTSDVLFDLAGAIADPASAAQAFVALAVHPKTSADLRHKALDAGIDRLQRIGRETQVAEVVPVLLKRLRASDTDAMERVVAVLLALPDGEALSKGLREAAKSVPAALRPTLFDRALGNQGHERDDAKAVLRAAFTRPADLERAEAWRSRLGAVADPGLRIRLAAFLHHQVAALDPRHPCAEAAMHDTAQALEASLGTSAARERVDLWRAVVQAASSRPALGPLAEVLGKEPPMVRADVALALGAQADRLGDVETARRLFDHAEGLLSDLEAAAAERVGRKLEVARRHLRGGPAPESAPRSDDERRGPQAAASVRLPPTTGHALALCNTYTGGLKSAHFRAIARAAPLCAAFGLDLVLIGFPAPLAELVERTARETRIGGRPWVRDLAAAGRVHEIDLDPAKDPASRERRGTWIATSERPEARRSVALDEVAPGGPLCLVMGIGPKGLPLDVRRSCAGEYEITGHGIGLETATVMGILAERLHRRAAGAMTDPRGRTASV